MLMAWWCLATHYFLQIVSITSEKHSILANLVLRQLPMLLFSPSTCHGLGKLVLVSLVHFTIGSGS